MLCLANSDSLNSVKGGDASPGYSKLAQNVDCQGDMRAGVCDWNDDSMKWYCNYDETIEDGCENDAANHPQQT